MEQPLKQVFVGVGANLGDRLGTIDAAIADLSSDRGIWNIERSPLFETEPVGGIAQPTFINLVIGLETSHRPETLLEVLHATEKKLGRNRALEQRWGPRAIDLDILLFEGVSRTGGPLELPHPRMWDRGFVTIPLAELIRSSARYDSGRWPGLADRLSPTKAAGGVRPYVTAG